MPILEVRNVSVSLDGRTILEDVSFSMERSDSLAIIGPNGAGKTVLLKCLLGLLPYRGEVRWSGVGRPAWVPQKIDADRSVPLNVRNLLDSKASITGNGRAAIEHVISHVGLSENVLSTQIGKLSGGQFQRALIAFALLGDPEVVLFDEPAASLDEPGEEQLYELLHRLQNEHGLSVIVVSHDLSFVYRYATKVLCLNRTGTCFGPPKDLTPETLEELFGAKMVHDHLHRT
ncbi:MAG: metal ABC transporter ATP-binding protein [Thermoanaerobaculia bacterium]